jgi:hypothetical protein
MATRYWHPTSVRSQNIVGPSELLGKALLGPEHPVVIMWFMGVGYDYSSITDLHEGRVLFADYGCQHRAKYDLI